VVASLDRGGAESQVAELARRLDRRRFSVSVALLTHPGAMFEDLSGAGLRVELVRPDRATPWSWVNWLRGLIARLREERPHVVHGFLFPTYSLTALAVAKVGGCAAVAGVRSLGLGLEQRLPYWAVERLGNRLSAAVVANAEAVRQAAIRRDPGVAGRIQVIHNGVDLAKYGRRPDAGEVRREIGVGPDDKLVLMVANLIAYKGHHDALLAFAAARHADPGLRLVLAGAGPEESRLRRLAAELGLGPAVLFLGMRADVPRLMSAADVFLLASHEEGFPNAVLEAMASGLPIVATDVGGVREQLGDPACGVLVPARDPERLADGLGRVVREGPLRLGLGRAARVRAEAEFGWDVAVARYSELYEDLVRSGGAQARVPGSGA
jgi:glycosyltransferase involved in cell wall biosynthesis